ncbi:tetratricopeptide repeat protein [Treponema sp. HNW]|uniref:tetratricopeptide repeat protein n=1 Tax=Treponema sp. HNW TaxID=3116654 RepID=UPI003D12317D
MKRTALLCMMMFGVLYAQNSQKTVRTVVSDISVQASERAIVLTWSIKPDAVPHIKELCILRSFERISSIPREIRAFEEASANSNMYKEDKSLLRIGAVPPETTEYTDTDTEPNKTYYYAVAAVTASGDVYDLIVPALNASVRGVSPKDSRAAGQKQRESLPDYVNEKQKTEEEMSPVPEKTPEIIRGKPLASLRIFPETPPARVQKTGERVQKKAENAIGNGAGHREKEADILPGDTSDRGMSGDDYSLFVIVDSLVKTKKWNEAETELKRFLQINRSEEAAARAYFYLGQSLYFNGNYREALACFQNSRVLYPVLSKRWSTETLDAYRIEGHLID